MLLLLVVVLLMLRYSEGMKDGSKVARYQDDFWGGKGSKAI
jgi:hypothetical protein